jgi:hypothetical protein
MTGGTKTTQNWHTYIYVKKAGLEKETRLFIGSNGEFMRSYYLDRGILSLAADLLASGWALRKFWSLKLKHIFNEEETHSLCPELAKEFSPESKQDRLDRLIRLCGPGLLNGLDRFYLGQRVSNFIANGLALVRNVVTPITPMLDHEWNRLAWSMGRRWKMNSRWHRFGIEKNYSELLDFDKEAGGPMREPGKPLYWMRRKPISSDMWLVNYPKILRDGPLVDFITDNASILSDLMDPAMVRAAVDEHRRTGNRIKLISLLICLIFWKKQLVDLAKPV